MESFLIINKNDNTIISKNFILIQDYTNETINNQFVDEYSKLFKQVMLDFPREHIYIDQTKALHISDVLYYIQSQPYLKINKNLVLFFLCQTPLSIPLKKITLILHKINPEIIVCESKKKSRLEIILYSDEIIINKSMSGIILLPNGNIKKILNLDINIKVDLVNDKTTILIQSDFLR